MTETTALDDLIKTPEAQRDSHWEASFLTAFPAARLRILSEAPVLGPDSWPYLMAEVDPSGTEPAGKVLGWLSDRGIGLVINPTKATPDYVFTYGMIWNFRERNEFLTKATAVEGAAKIIAFEKGTPVQAGPPSQQFLPDYVKNILRAFLEDNGFRNMKILVISTDQQHYHLCFSFECFGCPPENERASVLEALSWFLPAHYSLTMVGEAGLPAFHPL